MKNTKLLPLLLIVLMCSIGLTSYADQPKKEVAVSFSFFKSIIDNSPEELIQYIRHQGYVAQKDGSITRFSVRGGKISIYPVNYTGNRQGVGPVEFSTNDSQIVAAWRNGLKKMGYSCTNPEYGIWQAHSYDMPVFGIKNGTLFLAGYATSTEDHSAQGLPTTYTGYIGKYKITMVLDIPSYVDTGLCSVTGVYWYGDGKNGKMTLKGWNSFNATSKDDYSLDEYDPNGNKCGHFELKRGSESLTGTMKNKAGKTFKVELKLVE